MYRIYRAETLAMAAALTGALTWLSVETLANLWALR